MNIYNGPDGKKYVETGDYTVPREKAKPGTVYNCELFGSESVSFVGANPGEWSYSNKILRLATPEEIAGTEKPGVHLTPESVGKRFVTASGEVTGPVIDAHGSGGSYVRFQAKLPFVGDWGWNEFGKSYPDRTYKHDIISEWDEKAEAGVTPEGAATPNACTAKKAASAPPAQPAILPTWTDGDIDAFMAKRGGNVNAVMSVKRRYVLALMEGRTPKADKPDRRAEHVPVAKAWVNPAKLGK